LDARHQHFIDQQNNLNQTNPSKLNNQPNKLIGETTKNNRLGDMPFIFALFYLETQIFLPPWKIKPEHFPVRVRKNFKKKYGQCIK